MLSFCINLESSHDRRFFMQQQFDHLGLNVSLIKAVDGSKLTHQS